MAYYTRLDPGSYKFEVMASNEQGTWAAVPSGLAFEVLPAWYQTYWFRALAFLLCLALLWLGYLLRARMLRSRDLLRMREISSERERIARDLHDTLLQSMQGVILGFQGMASALPANDHTRQSVEAQLDRADRLLGEARDRVRDLRTSGDDSVTLGEAFQLASEDLSGTVQISVEHEFGYLRFVLAVIDDGVGIDSRVLAAGARPGHYGLVGMRERASQLGGELTISRVGERGTRVELKVPAHRAYDSTALGRH